MPNNTTDTKVDELIINTLTKEQYDDLVTNSQVEANQLYLTKDENYYTQVDVIYGTTTYAQITQMLSDGEQPICNYNGCKYYYSGLNTDYYFTCVINDTVQYIKVDNNNNWSNNQYSLPILTIVEW